MNFKSNKRILFENTLRIDNKFSISEGVEHLTVDGETNYFRNSNTYAFSVYDDNLIVSKEGGAHGDAIIQNFNLKLPEDEAMFYKIKNKTNYWGRIWIDFKTISFWDDYLPNNVINDIKSKLKQYFPKEDINNYKIEMH